MSKGTTVAPYEIFGEKRNVPVHVYYNGEPIAEPDKWSHTLWISKTEEWFALHNPKLKDKYVRVVAKFWWDISKAA